MINRFRGPYAFLSNFYPVPITYDGDQYLSVEAAYQASKSLSPVHREAVRDCSTDFLATKRLGQLSSSEPGMLASGFPLRPGWGESLQLDIMRSLVRQKFNNYPDLRALLLQTWPEDIVEGNSWGDAFFGVCNGEGANHLGHILMEVRAELIGENPRPAVNSTAV
jgi:ribA/ribD-fused uncharacterized protein